jgi:hypothetical protein
VKFCPRKRRRNCNLADRRPTQRRRFQTPVCGSVLRGRLNGNGKDVDVIIQVGTNFSMVRLAAAAELWLGKLVIAINTATIGTHFAATGQLT